MMIQQADVTNYFIRQPNFDFRHDLHVFVNYMRSRSIKRRSYQHNLLKDDVKRLSKLLVYPDLIETYEEGDYPVWLDFLDAYALVLGFLGRDMLKKLTIYEGMDAYADPYEYFLSQELSTQEKWLMEIFRVPYQYDYNEFFIVSPLGWLDSFYSIGYSKGILPYIDFAAVRLFLLQQLRQLEVGKWYETASWVAYLKQNHPYFLIPEKPMREKHDNGLNKPHNKKSKREVEYELIPRYEALLEKYPTTEYRSIPVDAPDGFERVEGRYIERFLEYIPFLLGYVELAYDPNHPQERKRWLDDRESIDRDMIKAFRITPLFPLAFDGKLPPPNVTVQPNFEVVVESPIYPAQLMRLFSKFGKLTGKSTTTTFTLDKQTVIKAVAIDETLDIPAILKTYSKRELPQNILIELNEWVKRADIFTLYHGLELVEDAIGLDSVRSAMKYQVGEGLYLVPQADNMGGKLKSQGQVVIQVVHLTDAFADIPKDTKSIFPSEKPVNQAEPETVTIQRENYITLRIPQAEVLEAIRQGLVNLQCLLTVNQEAQTLTFSSRYQDSLAQIIASLKDTYTIKIQEIES